MLSAQGFASDICQQIIVQIALLYKAVCDYWLPQHKCVPAAAATLLSSQHPPGTLKLAHTLPRTVVHEVMPQGPALDSLCLFLAAVQVHVHKACRAVQCPAP